MNEILEFLQSDFLQSKISDINEIPHNVKVEPINIINDMFLKNITSNKTLRTIKQCPTIEKFQLWKVKDEYADYLSKTIKLKHPIIVIVTSDLEELAGESFVRIQVISPFIQFKADDDVVCDDPSIIGFPFLIEKWNEIPVLTDLFDQYLGYYHYDEKFSNLDNILNQDQKAFREIEILNARYLSHSITSLIDFMENQQAEDAGVVVSLFDDIYYPDFYIGDKSAQSSFSLAAKSGIIGEDKVLILDNERLPFTILIRKNEEGYIITLNTNIKVQLFDKKQNEFSCIRNKDKAVFHKLSPGAYDLLYNDNATPITIRLK